MSINKNVLIVDDQESFRDAVAFEFEMMGWTPTVAINGEDGLTKYKEKDFDLVLSDIRMPGWGGRRLLNEIRQISKKPTPFILMTGFAGLKPYEAFHEGADALLRKPIDHHLLAKIVENLHLPLEKRWCTKPTEKTNGEIKFDAVNDAQLQIGKIGLFIPASANEQILKLNPETLVDLDIICELANVKKITGIGKVLWVRSEEVEGLQHGIGVQFEYLSDECLSEIIAYIKKNNSLNSIPKGEWPHHK